MHGFRIVDCDSELHAARRRCACGGDRRVDVRLNGIAGGVTRVNVGDHPTPNFTDSWGRRKRGDVRRTMLLIRHHDVSKPRVVLEEVVTAVGIKLHAALGRDRDGISLETVSELGIGRDPCEHARGFHGIRHSFRSSSVFLSET